MPLLPVTCITALATGKRGKEDAITSRRIPITRAIAQSLTVDLRSEAA
jgi:hypothetical protein